jgi:hypothetical protein
MSEFTAIELEAARKAILSTIRKTEKVIETLSRKQPPRTSQIAMASQNLKVLYIAYSLIEKTLGKASSVDYSRDELEEALQSMASLIRKIEEVEAKFREGTPQHTLAVRRIKAFQIASALIRED